MRIAELAQVCRLGIGRLEDMQDKEGLENIADLILITLFDDEEIAPIVYACLEASTTTEEPDA